MLGFGRGNYNDALMQTLAQNGNGVAAYIDTLNEARKVLVDEASSTLFPIAKDVKIQVEFNPARVAEYRLIGYETRMLRREDFNNDKVDAGDIGSGHCGDRDLRDHAGRQRRSSSTTCAMRSRRCRSGRSSLGRPRTPSIGFLKIRYKLPKEDTSRLIELGRDRGAGAAQRRPGVGRGSRSRSAVAAFGQLLRGGASSARLWLSTT